MSAARWQRLADDLAAADFPADVQRWNYPGGVSESIGFNVPDLDVRVEVHDKWWRKNADVWIGWQVHVEDAEGIIVREWPLTKKRSQVVAAVRDAVAR
jgi:hypothetical protein